MNTGIRLALSLSALSFAVACGPTEDPSKNNTSSNNPTNGSTNNPTNGSTNNPTNGNTGGNNPTNGNTNNPTNGNTGGTNNPTTGGPCEVNDVFFGQIDATNDDHAGGVPSTDPLPTDAGLAGALAAFDVMEDMTQDVDIDITGATVIATNFGDGGNTNFWVQDSGASMQVFLGFDTVVDFMVKVGDKVDFKITQFGNFSGNPQIAALEGLSVTESGTAVPYTDLSGMPVTIENYNKNVRIGGTLSATGESCGGSSFCYTLTHGTETIEFRTASTFIEGGECVTFFGPLGVFPGPNADSGTTPKPQLNTSNFSWSWTKFN